jgi:hypothetical protein
VFRPVIGGFRPAAIRTKEAAQLLAPKKTGKLAKGTRVQFTGATSGLLINRVPYVYPVTGGAKPHVIGPRKKQAVIAPGGPYAHVDHPGISGNPFLNKAALGFSIAYAAEVRKRWR